MAVTRREDGRAAALLARALRERAGLGERRAEAEERFRELLRAAVERRLVADVPLGAFLSGGLDSSTVVALMAEEAEGRVQTFTIGFEGGTGLRRARPRARGGRALRDGAHGVRGRAEGARPHRPPGVAPRRSVRRLVGGADVPALGADAIAGHGGPQRRRRRRGVRRVPAPLRRGALGDASRGRSSGWRPACWAFCPSPRDRKHLLRFAKRFAEAGSLPLARALPALERVLHRRPAGRCCGPSCGEHCGRERILAELPRVLDRPAGRRSTTLARLLELNFETYLLDDLLVKMDRMSMAHGLEARSPFLDTAVVEFGASLPDRLRMRLRQGEDPAAPGDERASCPTSILARGKMGFGAPLGAWFRSDLDGFVRERLLDPASPINEYLQPAPVARLVEHHGRARGRPVGADLGAAHARELAAAGEGLGEPPRSALDLTMASPARKPATYEDLLKLPDDKIGEIVDGDLYASPRPAGRHASCAFTLSSEIGPPFQARRGGPGGWLFLFEPELHLADDTLVPDLAGWRRDRLPVGTRRAGADARSGLGLRDPLAVDRAARPGAEAAGLRPPRRGLTPGSSTRRPGRSRCTAAKGRAGCWRPPTPTTRSYERSHSTRWRSTSCACGARSGRRRPAETRPARDLLRGSSTRLARPHPGPGDNGA